MSAASPRAFARLIRPTELRLKTTARGAEAIGFETPQGFLVRAGSRATLDSVESIKQSPHLVEMREALTSNGVLKRDGATYVLTQDYVFPSPSSAAGVLLGRSANGRIEWVAADGRTLRSLQEAEAGKR